MVEHTNPPIPTGFTKVSRERFFVLLSKGAVAELRPKQMPDHMTWETTRGEISVSEWTAPGWRNSGALRQYAVRDDVAQDGKAL